MNDKIQASGGLGFRLPLGAMSSELPLGKQRQLSWMI